MRGFKGCVLAFVTLAIHPRVSRRTRNCFTRAQAGAFGVEHDEERTTLSQNDAPGFHISRTKVDDGHRVCL